MGVKTATTPYEIVSVEGEKAKASVFEDYRLLPDVPSEGTAVWNMTDTANMKNYDTDSKGIKPGSYGAVSFLVRVNEDEVKLDLKFDIVGYTYSEETDSDTKEVTNQTMTRASDELQGYLNGHILLFEERTPVIEEITDPQTHETTQKVVGYTYSKPILSQDDLSRTISGRTYKREDSDKVRTIYWVWAETLSSLVKINDVEYVRIDPMFDDADTVTVVHKNIVDHLDRYFCGITAEDSAGLTKDNLSARFSAENYEYYSGYYDKADNEIGSGISYVTLELSGEMKYSQD